jgi:hypothetical protein
LEAVDLMLHAASFDDMASSGAADAKDEDEPPHQCDCGAYAAQKTASEGANAQAYQRVERLTAGRESGIAVIAHCAPTVSLKSAGCEGGS